MKRVVFALMFLLVFAHGALALIGLDHNETFIFNYTVNGTNLSESFFCEAANTCTANTTIQELNVTVIPGQTETFTEGLCKVKASCTAEAQSNDSRCVLTRSLDPGKSYEFKNGACDVEIDVDSCEDASNDYSDNYDAVKLLRITKDVNNLTITIDNESVNIPSQASTFSYEQEIGLTCPGRPSYTNDADADALLEICRQFTPFLVNDWIRPTLESCKNSAESYVNDVKDCSEETRSVQNDLGDCRAEVSSTLSTLDACNTAKEAVRGQLDAAEQRATTWFVVALGFATLSLLLGLAVGALIWQRANDGGGY